MTNRIFAAWCGSVWIPCVLALPPPAIGGSQATELRVDSVPSAQNAAATMSPRLHLDVAGGERAGSCPGSGGCCVANGTPGCSDFDCCDLICFLDSYCCDVEWDQECANMAISYCDPDACGGACPGSGDCCESNGTPGCENELCCDLVCTEDPYCCNVVWDADCVWLARTQCDVCGQCPAGEGNCCVAHDTPSCDYGGCCQAVCAEYPQCCEVEWDQACADAAATLCPVCTVCLGDGGPCCQSNGTPGCDDVDCCSTVCFEDEFCCFIHWDTECARTAEDLCGTLCTCLSIGDFDENGTVDLADFAGFQNCYTGSQDVLLPDACACADFDGDHRSDLTDYAAFHALLIGP